MRVLIVTPAPSGSTKGNRITAERWFGFLQELGHEVKLADQLVDAGFDCLITLHATRSHQVIQSFRERCPQSPVILCLTGTDLHLDLKGLRGDDAKQLAAAAIMQSSQIVLLEPQSASALPEAMRSKANVILQSAKPVQPKPAARSDVFEVCVVGHLREVKDPFLVSIASRRLPSSSRIVVSHIGRALDSEMQQRAEAEARQNPRYDWLGELSHEQTQCRMAQAKVMILSSKVEGAPSVISEAIVNHTPILATRIPATTGLLGSDYAGLFPVGDAGELASLMNRVEKDREYLAELRGEIASLAKKFSPELERKALEELLSFVARERP